MYKNFNLTESEREQILNQHKEHGYKKSLNEQAYTQQKWGKGTLIRLPKGSNNTNDAIRIQSEPLGDKNDVIIGVQSNKKVRAEIKGINVFNTIESMLGHKFHDEGNWSLVSGLVDSNTYNKIVKLLSSLNVDEKNNTFTNQSSSLNELEVGGFKEGPGEKLTPELKHYNTIVKPQLLKAGFKDSYEKVMEPYGTENSMVYGNHNTGVNVMWNRKKGVYSVYIGNDKGLKTFQLGPNDPRLVANKVVQYALSLKGGGTSLNEQSVEDYSSDMDNETQSNGINLQEQLLFIVEHLDGGHTEDSSVTSEKMIEVLKETIKQFVNPNDSITVRDWEKLYYSITNDMYA